MGAMVEDVGGMEGMMMTAVVMGTNLTFIPTITTWAPPPHKAQLVAFMMGAGTP